jgi:hypothetical protein
LTENTGGQPGQERAIGELLASEESADDPGHVAVSAQADRARPTRQDLRERDAAFDDGRGSLADDGMGSILGQDDDVAGAGAEILAARHANGRAAGGHQVIVHDSLRAGGEQMGRGVHRGNGEGPG